MDSCNRLEVEDLLCVMVWPAYCWRRVAITAKESSERSKIYEAHGASATWPGSITSSFGGTVNGGGRIIADSPYHPRHLHYPRRRCHFLFPPLPSPFATALSKLQSS